MISDDALIAAPMAETDMAQEQDGGVFHHHAIPGTDVSEILHLRLVQDFVVLLPRKGHGGTAAAGCRAGKADVLAEDRDSSFWLNYDLGLGEIL